jgi:hypothetical protein
MALGSTQPLTEMSTRNLPGVKVGRLVTLTTLPPSVSRLSRENVGASTSHNPMGLHDLLTRIALPLPITVTARSKARIVFARSNTGIVGSNPTQNMDVCVRLFCVCVVLCVGSGLVTG